MTEENGVDPTRRWQGALAGLKSPREAAARLAELTVRSLECDRCGIWLDGAGAPILAEYERGHGVRHELISGLRLKSEKVLSGEAPVALPLFFSEGQQAGAPPALTELLRTRGVLSSGFSPLFCGGRLAGWIECHFMHRAHRWQRGDVALLGEIAEYAAASLSSGRTPQPAAAAAESPPEEEAAAAAPESEPAAWMIMDILRDGRIAYVSSKVEDLAGRDPGAVKGARVYDFLDGLLLDLYKPDAFRSIKCVLAGQAPRSEFFAEALAVPGGEPRHLLFQLEAETPPAERAVLVITDVTASRVFREKLDEAKLRSMRLVQYGNLIIIRTDHELRITDILGDTDRIFGVSPHVLLYDEEIWQRFLDPTDMRLLRRMIKQMGERPRQMSREIRVKHHRSGEVKWVLLNAVPLFSAGGEFTGWEGFGVDVTAKREAEEELVRQSRRIEALYEVSRSLQVDMDPAVVTLRGLRALLGATNADGGFAVFCDHNVELLEIVAAQGLSQRFLDEVAKVLGGRTLLSQAIDSREGLLIDNIHQDPRAAGEIWRSEGLRSVIIMPLTYEDRSGGAQVQGAIILACRRAGRFSDVDFELTQAAARQLALIVRQAEFFASEKRQAGSLAALYRMSHELSKLVNPREIGEHAFPILQEELAAKRIWFGTISEQGTHLAGQGGVGPGMRRALAQLQIPLEERHDFLDEAVREKRAVIVEGGAQPNCAGLERLLGKLKVGTFVIVPLVALGKVVGVLMVEPEVPAQFFAQKKLALLSSMGSEIATVILARRFEAKMADADKMRMAGLLASGVAHNFNNLLQAVMGQASLIEMQLERTGTEPLLQGAARTIVESAAKGARLIKQMLTLTRQGTFAFKPLSINEMLGESVDLYRSLLGPNAELDVQLAPDLPGIRADYGQLQQVMANLVVNALEAIGRNPNGQVKVSSHKIKLAAGQVDPELPAGWYVRVDVADNGRGMDEHELSRCFEPFYTTKNVDSHTGIGLEGSGLGLSLSYSILKQHEGLLAVHSVKDEGTIFSLYLPAAAQPQSVEAPVSTAARRALLVDAEENVPTALRATLEAAGFSAEVVSSPAESLDAGRRRQGAFDLVLVNLDRLSAPEEARGWLLGMRAAQPQAPISAVSSNPRRWQTQLSDLEGVRLVERQVAVSALHAVLRELLYRRPEGSLTGRVEVQRSAEQAGEQATKPEGITGNEVGKEFV